MDSVHYVTEHEYAACWRMRRRWGLTYDEADTLWRRDELDIPELRDLWLIWSIEGR